MNSLEDAMTMLVSSTLNQHAHDYVEPWSRAALYDRPRLVGADDDGPASE